MKIRHTIALLLCIGALATGGNKARAQSVTAGVVSFTPESFEGYPESGTFKASFTKTSGTIPGLTAQIVFTMVPEVPWNGDEITIPPGWVRAGSSTATNIRFVLVDDWTDASGQTQQWSIPVTSALGRDETWPAATSQIQQLDGDWTVATPLARVAVTVGDVAMPVTLTTFTAAKEGSTTLLKWTTTEETNSERFDIEHSLNGKNWIVIGSVKSKGESTVLQRYSFVHPEPVNGENLYRLKMIDNDGSFAYSKIQQVTFNGLPEQNIVFPNPASGRIELGVKDLAQVKSVRIYDLAGRAMYSATGKAISKIIDIRSLSSGAYVVELVYKTGKAKTVKVAIVQ